MKPFLHWILLFLAPVLLSAQQVALTFDDGPKTKRTPLLSPEDRNQALLNHLAKVSVPAALFVTLHNGRIRPRGSPSSGPGARRGTASETIPSPIRT